MTSDEQYFLSVSHAYDPLIIIRCEGGFLVGTGWPGNRRFLFRGDSNGLLHYLESLEPRKPARFQPALSIDELEIDI